MNHTFLKSAMALAAGLATAGVAHAQTEVGGDPRTGTWRAGANE